MAGIFPFGFPLEKNKLGFMLGFLSLPYVGHAFFPFPFPLPFPSSSKKPDVNHNILVPPYFLDSLV